LNRKNRRNRKSTEKSTAEKSTGEKSTGEKEPKGHSCTCHKMSMFVMDISRAISENQVEWLTFYSNNGLETPEVAILYSLSAARGELIMFGGIQRDGSQGPTGAGARQNSHENDRVTNALYFLTPPSQIV